MHNVSLVTTSVITAHLVNQLVFGYNYFLQTFNSFDFSADPIAMGLNTGVYRSDAGRAAEHHDQRVRAGRRHAAARPRRQDDPLHQQPVVRRPARISSRSAAKRACRSCSSSTTATSAARSPSTAPPARGRVAASTASASLKSLADYMAGIYAPRRSSCAATRTTTTSRIRSISACRTPGSLTSKVTLNFGVRYTYPGVLGASDAKLTNFLPDKGMVSTDALYPVDKKDVSPRVGITYVPWDEPQDGDPRRLRPLLRHVRGEFLHREHRLRQRRRARRRQQPGRRDAGLLDHAAARDGSGRRPGVRHDAAAAVRRVRGEPGSQAAVRRATSTSTSSSRSSGHGHRRSATSARAAIVWR